MGPPCNLSGGKHGIGIAGDTSPDVLWTGWSDRVHLWEEETETGGSEKGTPHLSSSQALPAYCQKDSETQAQPSVFT